MPTVVGVRLRFSKTLWFDPGVTAPQDGDVVVVETERGEELGLVTQAPHEVQLSQLPAALKPVVRVANDEDLAYAEELHGKEREAMPVFRSLVEERKLDMKPVDVEYALSGDRITFYFSAEERVDFRDLVKDLASRFHARIDMRQVGVRDEARAVGGVGHCGQMLCCVRFGGEFQPVSIRMAKEQDLPLNPLKISGLCGRLMCCLRYEYDAYKDFKSRAPKRGAVIDTAKGLAKVAELNTPKETVRLRFEDGSNLTVPLGAMECKKGGTCPCCVGEEALEAAGAPPALVVAPIVEPPAPRKSAEPARSEESSGGGRRKRRRRGGGEKAEGGETATPAAKAKPQPSGESKEAGPVSGADGDAAKKSRSGRRRRRRRPKGGGADAPK